VSPAALAQRLRTWSVEREGRGGGEPRRAENRLRELARALEAENDVRPLHVARRLGALAGEEEALAREASLRALDGLLVEFRRRLQRELEVGRAAQEPAAGDGLEPLLAAVENALAARAHPDEVAGRLIEGLRLEHLSVPEGAAAQNLAAAGAQLADLFVLFPAMLLAEEAPAATLEPVALATLVGLRRLGGRLEPPQQGLLLRAYGALLSADEVLFGPGMEGLADGLIGDLVRTCEGLDPASPLAAVAAAALRAPAEEGLVETKPLARLEQVAERAGEGTAERAAFRAELRQVIARGQRALHDPQALSARLRRLHAAEPEAGNARAAREEAGHSRAGIFERVRERRRPEPPRGAKR
jgi:hypothetical protein